MKIIRTDKIQAQQPGYTIKYFNEIIDGERYCEDNGIEEATVSFTFSYGYQFKFKDIESENKNMEDFIKALRENKAYDWIANNGWKLSKDELIQIIKEYDYSIPGYVENHIHTKIAEELEDNL